MRFRQVWNWPEVWRKKTKRSRSIGHQVRFNKYFMKNNLLTLWTQFALFVTKMILILMSRTWMYQKYKYGFQISQRAENLVERCSSRLVFKTNFSLKNIRLWNGFPWSIKKICHKKCKLGSKGMLGSECYVTHELRNSRFLRALKSCIFYVKIICLRFFQKIFFRNCYFYINSIEETSVFIPLITVWVLSKRLC